MDRSPVSRPIRWNAASALPAGDLHRIERAIGWRPTVFRPTAPDRPESATAARWIVADSDQRAAVARSAFVKIGATPLTAEWIRAEHRNYRSLEGPFLPGVLGFADGDRPVLALEDLSGAGWPPPWTEERVVAVIDAVAAIRETPPPAHLEPLEVEQAADWQSIARDPSSFLSLGICSGQWLDRALATLIAAASEAPLTGGVLTHLDIRSDNLCFREGMAVILDWNHATLAGPSVDVAFWLPSLHSEGGPPPEAILSDAPQLAAWVAGFFCARAGGPPVQDAPHVRPLQIRQARVALPWAARALGLTPP